MQICGLSYQTYLVKPTFKYFPRYDVIPSFSSISITIIHDHCYRVFNPWLLGPGLWPYVEAEFHYEELTVQHNWALHGGQEAERTSKRRLGILYMYIPEPKPKTTTQLQQQKPLPDLLPSNTPYFLIVH